MTRLRVGTSLEGIHRIVGWKGWSWLTSSMLSSLAYSGIELLFAYFLAHLLFLLQVSSSDPAPPFFIPSYFQSRTGALPFLLLIGVVRTLLRVHSTQSIVVFGETVRSRLRFIFFHQIYDPRRPRMAQSETNTWLVEIFPRTADFAISIANLLINAIQVLCFFAIMVSNSLIKAIAGLAAIVVLGPIVRFSHRHVRRLSQDILEDVIDMQRSIVRASRNWLLIRLLRTEARELTRLGGASLSNSQRNVRMELVNGLSSSLPELAGIIVVTLLIWLQFGFAPQSGAAFVAFLYVFLRFNQALVQVGGQLSALGANYTRFQKSAEMVSKLSDKELALAVSPLRKLGFIGRSKPESLRTSEVRTTNDDLIHTPPSIVFDGVGFSYPEGPAVIRNLSFDVPSGSAFGIMGPSGVGKSTLLALLMGIEKPNQGRVRLIADKTEFDPIGHRLTVGYVGPEPFLVAGSVAENLLYGAVAESSTAAMTSALRRAGFPGTDLELQRLLDAQVTEDGEGLSTGQKQRLCLARALLSMPALLVLDEVSANLDIATESTIAETVSALRGDSTIVIVSHREGMLEPCDHILDLGSGSLRHAAEAKV